MIVFKYLDLLIQEFSEVIGSKSLLDIMAYVACYFLAERGYTVYPQNVSITPDCPYGSIEYCEQAYKQGYEAIINDGRLLGFKKVS